MKRLTELVELAEKDSPEHAGTRRVDKAIQRKLKFDIAMAHGRKDKHGIFDGQHLFKDNPDVFAYYAVQLKFNDEDEKKEVIAVMDDFAKKFKGSSVFGKKVYFKKDDKWVGIGFTEK